MTAATRFEQVSGEHIAVLALSVMAAVACVAAARRTDGARAAVVSRLLAAVLLGAFVAEHIAFVVRGTWALERNLPLHLTDAVTLVSIAALWRPRPPLVELLWFWTLTGSLQAIVTPDLTRGFPSIFFVTYFVTHSGAVAAACVLVLGRGLLPRPGAMWRTYAITATFALLAAAGNVVTGGNYMFLREKPAQASLLDVMGPWPVYILTGAALALALFAAVEGLTAALRERPGARPSRGASTRQ